MFLKFITKFCNEKHNCFHKCTWKHYEKHNAEHVTMARNEIHKMCIYHTLCVLATHRIGITIKIKHNKNMIISFNLFSSYIENANSNQHSLWWEANWYCYSGKTLTDWFLVLQLRFTFGFESGLRWWAHFLILSRAFPTHHVTAPLVFKIFALLLMGKE